MNIISCTVDFTEAITKLCAWAARFALRLTCGYICQRLSRRSPAPNLTVLPIVASNMSLPAVLHPDVVDFLRQDVESRFRDQVGKCLLKLMLSQFNSGLRVKKLKGITKRVWEARINQA